MGSYGINYRQCDECKRLLANAYGCEQDFTLVAGRQLCWECTEKQVAKLGTVPPRPKP